MIFVNSCRQIKINFCTSLPNGGPLRDRVREDLRLEAAEVQDCGVIIVIIVFVVFVEVAHHTSVCIAEYLLRPIGRNNPSRCRFRTLLD